jgi:hypothetical protein
VLDGGLAHGRYRRALRSLAISAAARNHRVVQLGSLLATSRLTSPALVKTEEQSLQTELQKNFVYPVDRKCELLHTPYLVGKLCLPRPSHRSPQNLRSKAKGDRHG